VTIWHANQRIRLTGTCFLSDMFLLLTERRGREGRREEKEKGGKRREEEGRGGEETRQDLTGKERK
jgi:hypothetical protein